MNVVVVANRGDGDDGFVGERLSEHGANFVRVWREDPWRVINALWDLGETVPEQLVASAERRTRRLA